VRWHVDLCLDRWERLAMHVEWAVMAQHLAIVAKPPRSAGRLPAPVAIAASGLGLAVSLFSMPRMPELATVAPFAAAGFSCVLAAWLLVFVRRMRPRRHTGAAIRNRVKRLLGPLERTLPIAFDYELRDSLLNVRTDPPRALPNKLTAARAVVAVDVAALFRWRSSLLPWRIIHDPPRELVEELRRTGAEVIEVDKAPADYVDPLPVARKQIS
jgi:hypothetical protein